MNRHHWHIAWALAAAVAVGCDSREPDPVAQAPAPVTPVVASSNPTTTTDPAVPDAVPVKATQLASSELTIDGQTCTFPVARLRVGKTSNKVVARLFSDDPKAALKDDYVGNHFELLMTLDDIRDPQQIFQAVWQQKARSQEYVNEPYGIFLQGMRYQLQPMEVTARFSGDNFFVRVDLAGQFLMFDDRDKSAQPRMVDVHGSLMMPVEYKD